MAGIWRGIKREIQQFAIDVRRDNKYRFKTNVKYLREDCEDFLKKIQRNRGVVEKRFAERGNRFTQESLVQAHVIADQMLRDAQAIKEKIDTLTTNAEAEALHQKMYKTIQPEHIVGALKYTTPGQKNADVASLRDRRLAKEAD